MNHTVSLKLSRELKEKGFPQTTEFYWIQFKPDTNPNCHTYNLPQDEMPISIYWGRQSQLSTNKDRINLEIAAPLSSEIFELLPDGVEVIKTSGGYGCRIGAKDVCDDLIKLSKEV